MSHPCAIKGCHYSALDGADLCWPHWKARAPKGVADYLERLKTEEGGLHDNIDRLQAEKDALREIAIDDAKVITGLTKKHKDLEAQVDSLKKSNEAFRKAAMGDSEFIGNLEAQVRGQSQINAALRQENTLLETENRVISIALLSKEQKTMSHDVVNSGYTLKDVLKTDATEAAYRLAGSQLTKLSAESLAAALSGGDAGLKAKLSEFFKTQAGGAVTAGLLSLAIEGAKATKVPLPGEADRLARELRVKAMADGGDALADLLMGPLRQVIGLYLTPSPQEAPLGLEVQAEPVRAPEVVEVTESEVTEATQGRYR